MRTKPTTARSLRTWSACTLAAIALASGWACGASGAATSGDGAGAAGAAGGARSTSTGAHAGGARASSGEGGRASTSGSVGGSGGERSSIGGSGSGGGAGVGGSGSVGGAGGATTTTTTATTSSAATGGGGGACVPDCTGRMCGSDGCSGDCGACSTSLACTTSGQCVGSPPGPFAMRFDVATSQCGATDASCTIGPTTYARCCPSTVPGDPTNKCFCDSDLDHVNRGPAHLIVVASDAHRGDIWAAGNVQAAYINDLDDLYPASDGGAKADAAMADAQAGFPSGVPTWFLANEISTSLWPTDAVYRQYVRSFAARMKQTYGKSVIVASPFPAPANNATDWTALAGNAYVAVEVQLTGQEVNASGNSVSYCASQFQASATAYGSVGVGLTRLMLVDSYANSGPTTGFGRQGVSSAGWVNAIAARAAGAHQIGFFGYVSYAWGNNEMADDDATRVSYEDAYLTHVVP